MRLLILFVALLVGLFGELSFAQMPVQGQRTASLTIGGAVVSCAPAVWMADYTLNDVGVANPYASVIAYNPKVIVSMPPKVALFWLGHECGHITVPTSIETEADCWSVKTGVKQGWFGRSELAYLKAQLAYNSGDSTHPPGPVRLALMDSCVRGGKNNDDDGGSASDSQVSDDEANACLNIHMNSVDWHKTQDDPTVDYSYKFSNTCDKPIKCHSAVGIGYRPRGASDYSAFHQTDIAEKSLTILPNASRNVSGTMTWPTLIPSGTNPSIRHTRDNDTGVYAISCVFANQ